MMVDISRQRLSIFSATLLLVLLVVSRNVSFESSRDELLQLDEVRHLLWLISAVWSVSLLQLCHKYTLN
jgi:hypothetical protein